VELVDLETLSSGAQFFRADLHIHSFGASYDVRDATATPEAIIATAKSEGLAIIAITDHNEISNVAQAVELGLAAGILVVPGVELSTPEGLNRPLFAGDPEVRILGYGKEQMWKQIFT